jgi:uncharacterized protein YaeQ
MTGRKRAKHVIAYDSYWRCDCKPCTKCGIRPLTDFNKHANQPSGYRKVCRRCEQASLSFESRRRRLAAQRIWNAANPDRVAAYQSRYAKSAHGRIRKKLGKIAREMEVGAYALRLRDKNFKGFCAWMRINRRRQYAKYSTGSFYRSCMHNRTLIAAWRHWVEAGRPNALRPVLVGAIPSKAKVITYGEHRAQIVKRAWEKGKYATKVKNMRKFTRGNIRATTRSGNDRVAPVR